ncbi:hypothetical protein V8G54_006470 [Vigna mungo]|uniref:Protein kinase domain-containing protein n=1 Tax=Vigna mungo TaxID=3915 RepID=A0AAQ3P3D4_VIGMU
MEERMVVIESTMEEVTTEVRAITREFRRCSRNRDRSSEGRCNFVNAGRGPRPPKNSREESEEDRGEVRRSRRKRVELPTFEGRETLRTLERDGEGEDERAFGFATGGRKPRIRRGRVVRQKGSVDEDIREFEILVPQAWGKPDHSSLATPVDLGTSIMTGVEADVATERRPDPSLLICAQLGLELTILNSDCPLYDIVTERKASADRTFNSKRNSSVKKKSDEEILNPRERRIMGGCTTSLNDVSLPYWNQDDVYGVFGGAHCVIKGGYSSVVESLGEGITIHLNHVVTNMSYGIKEPRCNTIFLGLLRREEESGMVVAKSDNNRQFGVIRACLNKLIREVLACKSIAKDRLDTSDGLRSVKLEMEIMARPSGHPSVEGFVHLVMERCTGEEFFQLLEKHEWFSESEAKIIFRHLMHAVWYGHENGVVHRDLKPENILLATRSSSSPIKLANFGLATYIKERGQSYKIKVSTANGHEYIGATAEERNSRSHCFMFRNVRKIIGAPVLIALVVGKAAIDGQILSSSDHVKHALKVAYVVTDWVACQEHPDNVGGGMMSGLRESARIIDIVSNGNDYIAEEQLDTEKDEVRDIIKRHEAVRLAESSLAKSIYEMLEVNRIQEEWKILEEDLPPPKPLDLNWRASPGMRSTTANNSSLTSTLRTRLILRGGVILGIKRE